MLKKVAFTAVFATILSLGLSLECYNYQGSPHVESGKRTCPVEAGKTFHCMIMSIEAGPGYTSGGTVRNCLSKEEDAPSAGLAAALKKMPVNGCIKKETIDGELVEPNLAGSELTVTVCLCNEEDLCNKSLEELVKKADEAAAAAAAENGAAKSLVFTLNVLILSTVMAILVSF